MILENDSLSLKKAEAIACAYLKSKGLGNEISKRAVKSSCVKKGFKVVFLPPDGVRGGDFTLLISKGGEVVSKRFER